MIPAVGQRFVDANTGNEFVRKPDDPAPDFESERIRVQHVAHPDYHCWEPYTFGTEPEWFNQRKIRVIK